MFTANCGTGNSHQWKTPEDSFINGKRQSIACVARARKQCTTKPRNRQCTTCRGECLKGKEFETQKCTARPNRDQTASQSVRRALLTPSAKPGPLYRRGIEQLRAARGPRQEGKVA